MRLCKGFLPHRWENVGEVLEDRQDPDWLPIYARTRFRCKGCGRESLIALNYSSPPSRWSEYGTPRR